MVYEVKYKVYDQPDSRIGTDRTKEFSKFKEALSYINDLYPYDDFTDDRVFTTIHVNGHTDNGWIETLVNELRDLRIKNQRLHEFLDDMRKYRTDTNTISCIVATVDGAIGYAQRELELNAFRIVNIFDMAKLIDDQRENLESK